MLQLQVGASGINGLFTQVCVEGGRRKLNFRELLKGRSSQKSYSTHLRIDLMLRLPLDARVLYCPLERIVVSPPPTLPAPTV